MSYRTKAEIVRCVMQPLVVAVVFGIVAETSVGCGYGKPVCTIIDAADAACAVIRYLGPNGEAVEVRVPRTELEAFAREQAAKQAAAKDAGAP